MRPRKSPRSGSRGCRRQAANFYISAVEQGQTNLAIVRRATDLLYATGRSTEVSQLWSRLPAGSIVGGGLQDQAAVAALRNRDFKRALELASQAVEAHPNDFRERFFLAQILRLAGKQAEAVAELRKGVDLAPTDPDRWLNLILFLVQGGHLEDAEKVIPEAEAALPKDKAPLYLARYCEVLGLAYQENKAGSSEDEVVRCGELLVQEGPGSHARRPFGHPYVHGVSDPHGPDQGSRIPVERHPGPHPYARERRRDFLGTADLRRDPSEPQ